MIAVRIDRGFQGRQGGGVVTYTTDETGHFKVTAGDPCESWVTLTFQKVGFDMFQMQFEGRPSNPIQLCMTRAVAP